MSVLILGATDKFSSVNIFFPDAGQWFVRLYSTLLDHTSAYQVEVLQSTELMSTSESTRMADDDPTTTTEYETVHI